MLDRKEIEFIRTIAFDFIQSYSVNGQVKMDEEGDAEQILQEIGICQSILSKMGDMDHVQIC